MKKLHNVLEEKIKEAKRLPKSAPADLSNLYTKDEVDTIVDSIGEEFAGTMDDIDDGVTYKKTSQTEKNTYNGKQDALVSGTNIKTINSTSLLGSGDITVGSPTVASGAEVDTGTDNTKMVTPKAMEDSSYAKTAAIPVKATGSELNAQMDDAKFATALALADSDYLNVNTLPGLTQIETIDAEAHYIWLRDGNDGLLKECPISVLKAYLDTLYTPL